MFSTVYPFIQRSRSPWELSDTQSEVNNDENKFKVLLDVQHFSSKELQVRLVGNNVIVEGKHEYSKDEHGYVSRQFVRRFLLPSKYDRNKLKASLSSDGILTISAPNKHDENQERIIPIERTGPQVREQNRKDAQKQHN